MYIYTYVYLCVSIHIFIFVCANAILHLHMRMPWQQCTKQVRGDYFENSQNDFATRFTM